MSQQGAAKRLSRNASYAALLRDQAESSDALADLEEFDREVQSFPHTLVMLDRPAPARGYALLFPISDTEVGARMHVLEGQSEEALRVLFSTMLVQSRLLVSNLTQILVDSGTLSAHVLDAVDGLGSSYAIFANTIDGEHAGGSQNTAETGEETESISQTGDAENSSEIGGSEASDTDDELEVEDLSDYEDDLPPLEEVVEIESEKMYTCDKCGREFSSKQGLGAHRRTHKE